MLGRGNVNGCTEYRVQSTEYKVQSTGYRVLSTKYWVQSTEYRCCDVIATPFFFCRFVP